MNVFLTYILPVTGILILLFCILSFIFPYGEKFKGKIQKIKALGVDLEVSVLTLFIIVGVCMSSFGIYMQINSYEKQLYQAKIAKETAEDKLADAERRQITFVITLEDVEEDNMPKLEDIQCKYHVHGVAEGKKADVTKGYSGNQFRIVLKDIKTTAYIMSLVVEDLSTNRKWVKEGFAPFEPDYQLKKE